jgi:ribosomal protein S18 acetylase RimI-like enzyme
MKHIAKNRPGRRLAHALSALATSVRRTVAGRTVGEARQRSTRTGSGRGTRSLRAANVQASLALVPAHPAHFDWIAGNLREGAADGSFDRELATDSFASQLFFANLRQALSTGYFMEGKGDAAPAQVAASGCVFMLTRASRREVPVGFAMFKSMGGPGFELWLAGVDRRYRGRGFCKAMLRAALGTPAGMLAHVARVNRAGTSSDAIVKALEAVGYRHERDSAEVRWFVREDAPQAVVRMVRAGGARVGDG